MSYEFLINGKPVSERNAKARLIYEAISQGVDTAEVTESWPNLDDEYVREFLESIDSEAAVEIIPDA